MTSFGITTVLRGRSALSYYTLSNAFHTSPATKLNQTWRAENGLTKNPNAFGELTNLPDYSFKDGKPTPYGVRQKARIDKQKLFAERIVKLVEEVDYAVERHARMQREEKERVQAILDSKLKPKGRLYGKKKNKS